MKETMEIHFLPDNAISKEDEDRLGFGSFVELLQNSIYNTKPPFVYGIIGDWGVGKTSILNLLQIRIKTDFDKGTKPFIPIWFNAWQYENEANIIYPLLYAIKKSYDSHFGEEESNKGFWNRFKKLAVTSTMAFSDLGLRVATKQLTGEALKISDVVKQLEIVESQPDEIESILRKWADQVADLHKLFETLLDTYASDLEKKYGGENFQKDKIGFVILIDDLDRCLPETTIAILENIKNYLMVHKCVFILGLNANVIYQGIRIKYKGLEVDGRQYLEKILNYSFYVPEPELNKIAEFVTERFEQLLDDATYIKYRSNFGEFGKILEECHFTNPRKIKRILNRYLFFIRRYETKLHKYHNSNIVRFIILAEYFPDLFQLFLKDEETVRSLKKMLKEVGKIEAEIEHFEKKFSISIKAIQHQLSRMNKLFDLNLDTTDGKLNPAEEARDVFCITRLV